MDTQRLARSFFAAAAIITLTNSIERARVGANNDWAIASPEEVGMDSAALAEMIDFVRDRKIPVHSVQIVRHGKLALDVYFFPYEEGGRHDIASATKSVTSTLIGIAVDKGFLHGIDTPIVSLFPGRAPANLDERKRNITVQDLLTMRAGWDCGFEPNEARLFEMRRSADWVQFMLDLPMVATQGTRWAYCSGNCHLLSAAVTQATRTNALAFARRELFDPLRIQDVEWPADGAGNNHGWGDLQLHPRDMAKLGLLFLHQGKWVNQRVISEAWVQSATKAHVDRTANRDHYGYYWWVKGDDFPGMFEAVGRGGQRINVWPLKDMILVFTGGGFEPGDIAPFILKSLKAEGSIVENAEGSRRLKERVQGARKAPPARSPSKSSDIAAKISGKEFVLSDNALNLRSLRLQIGETEALVTVDWDGRILAFPAGLDGTLKFSTNSITGLRQGAKGEWIDQQTFLLEWDLVGGINFYSMKLAFAEDGARLDGSLKERTGLNEEHFTAIRRRDGN